jgi:hypothetical protein
VTGLTPVPYNQRKMRKLGLIVLLAMIGFAVAGCAGASGTQTPMTTATKKSQTTASPTNEAALRSVVHIVKLPRAQMHKLRFAGHGAAFVSPTRLAFETSGSSNCRGVPSTLSVTTPDSIRVRMKEEKPPNGICLADLVIEPVVIAISPKQINIHHALTVRLYYPRSKHPAAFTAPPLS